MSGAGLELSAGDLAPEAERHSASDRRIRLGRDCSPVDEQAIPYHADMHAKTYVALKGRFLTKWAHGEFGKATISVDGLGGRATTVCS